MARKTLFLNLSLLLFVTGNAVGKDESVESIENGGRFQLEERLLVERKARESDTARYERNPNQAWNQRAKTKKKTKALEWRKKDRNEVGRNIRRNSQKQRKAVKGGTKKRKQKSAATGNKYGNEVKKNRNWRREKGGSNKKGKKNKNKSKSQRQQKKKVNKKRKLEKVEKGKRNQNGKCLSTDCLDLAVSINELMRFKVINFQKQVKRILTKRSIGSKKSSKSGVFKPALSRLIGAGGNLSNPICAGSTNNTGARQITNLSETLTNCDANISALCDPANMPEVNFTFIEACESTFDAFEAFIARCSDLSGAAACSCWSGDSVSSAVIAAVRKCDLGDLPKRTRFALEDCKSAFGTCRKYEDDVADIVYACDQDADILKKKLKNLSENKGAVTQVQTKISNLINSTRGSRNKREDLNASTTAGFISLCQIVTTLIAQQPTNYLILIYSTSIINSNVTSFSASDLSSLSTISTQMAVAVTVLDAEISTATSTIEGKFKNVKNMFNVIVCRSDRRNNN